MNRKELIDLKARVITNRLLYEESSKQHSEETEQKMKDNNLSYDNEGDIDKIIDIDMKAEEKYKSDEFYKRWANDSDIFIINGLNYILAEKPKNVTKNQIETVKELINTFDKDKSKLIIRREQVLNILFKFKDFCN